MDDDKFDELYQLTVENNRMLHAMRRGALISGFLRFAFWVIMLIVIPYYTWLYVQPYVQSAQNAYQSAQTKATQADSTLTQIEKFFAQFGGSSTK